MAFGIGLHTEEKNEGIFKGVQCEVACGCWFTSKGRAMPKLIKYEDEEGQIREVRELHIHCAQEKNYDGIPTIEYDCEMKLQGRWRQVKLIYFKEECKWAIRKM